ncbi:hypothetical protein ABIF78_007660 [Bradyrhizobium japonicum]
MSDLKKGDRVTVKIYAQASWSGVIIGEARDGHAFWIRKDGTSCPRGIHKSFCQAEQPILGQSLTVDVIDLMNPQATDPPVK